MALTDAQIQTLMANAPNNLFELHPPQTESSVSAQLAADKAFWDRVVVLGDANIGAHAALRSTKVQAKIARGWPNA